VTVKGGRKGRSKAASRKVKSKEIVDDVASDESGKERDDFTGGGGGGTENSFDGKRKRQSHKSKVTSTVDKDGKPSRKRQTKNKVCSYSDNELVVSVRMNCSSRSLSVDE